MMAVVPNVSTMDIVVASSVVRNFFAADILMKPFFIVNDCRTQT
jgi:hypothetical protein